ncbi:MAG TPA: malate synthase A [Thermoanaerobaculia bacterium]|nr:malate synthase A [Thermoanaerobaculia bacterium]
MVVTDIEVSGEVRPEWDGVLSDEALGFVATLHKEFDGRRRELLAAREARKQRLDAGELPDFLPETREIRESEWTVAPIPHDLRDRRVEITGPVDRKMIINALTSGANVFMADFEDANAPTWENCIQGQLNLIDAVSRTISFESGAKQYKLNDRTAVLLVRPRGWHLDEQHVTVDGQAVNASLFDFAIYFFHNAKELIARGSGPYFYLPKMESHLEARLWNDVFVRAQQELGVPVGTIRATVLIETILASFEMHEILWELRDHSAGLNCGRWDYIFSFIKKFRARRDFVTPDRGSITMDKAFLAAYVDLLIQTCHRRGVHAMGGMAAQIPIKGDDAANDAAFSKVRADKLREVNAGHDGTWVAHPGMVALAREVFDQHMPEPNQIATAHGKSREARELLELPEGVITEKGLRQNVNVGILYLEAWLGGGGAVPLYNLMEDAATAEISRTQLWQWIHHGAKLDDGRTVDADLYRRIRDEELASIQGVIPSAVAGSPASRDGRGPSTSLGVTQRPHLETAARIFDELILANELADFLTVPAYEELLRQEQA